MPSSREYLSYIMEQLAPLEGITTRQMMGEYIIYYQGRSPPSCAMTVCWSSRSRPRLALPAQCPAGPPYPGAKPMLLVEKWRMGLSYENAGGHGAGAARPKAKKTDGEKGVTGYGTMDHSAAGCKCKRKK